MHFKEIKSVWTKMSLKVKFIYNFRLHYCQNLWSQLCESIKTCTQLNTVFCTDDNILSSLTSILQRYTQVKRNNKKYYIIQKGFEYWHFDTIYHFLVKITSCFSFGFVAFFNFAVSTTSSHHSFVNWNRYPFSSPVKFDLLNFWSFFLISIVFQRLSRNLLMFVCDFAEKFPALASQTCCD